MKKWENPEIQTVCIEDTETLGAIKEVCQGCQSKKRRRDAEPVICWRCACCKTVYHAENDSPEASEEARRLANECEEKDIASGQCS